MIDIKEVGRIYETGGLWKEKTCYISGEHFKDGEKLVILIPSMEIRKNLKKIKGNVVAYLCYVEEWCQEVNSIEEFWEKMDSHKTPKFKLTKEQLEKIEIFVKAAYNCGYKKSTKKKNGSVVCTKNGTSDKVTYNVYSDNISYENRRKRQLFDSFIENQKITNVYNEFHKLLNDDKHSDYNAINAFSECMDAAIKTTNDIMGK